VENEAHVLRQDGALDTRLHRLEDLTGFLESSTCRRTHVQPELPRIYQRKKILPCNQAHDQRANEEDAELGEHERPMA